MPVLLVCHRNQRITTGSTPFSPLWTRSWPKLRIGSVEMTQFFFVRLATSLSDSPAASDALVTGYYNFDKELLQADQRLCNRFNKHMSKNQ